MTSFVVFFVFLTVQWKATGANSCVGRCDQDTIASLGCQCHPVCHFDKTCCKDQGAVCSYPKCTDMRSLEHRAQINIGLPKEKKPRYLRVVLQEALLNTDTKVYLAYNDYNCTTSMQFIYPDCIENKCTVLKTYKSYDDLAKNNEEKSLILSRRCWENTIRIYGGYIYCQEEPTRRYRTPTILKINKDNGHFIQIKEFGEALRLEDWNYCRTYDLNFYLSVNILLDSTGFWVMYKNTQGKYNIELIDHNDFGMKTLHTIKDYTYQESKVYWRGYEIQTFQGHHPMIVCGKMYYIENRITKISVGKATDIFDPSNNFTGPAFLAEDVDFHFSMHETGIHYNPRLNEVFIATAHNMRYALKYSVQNCLFHFDMFDKDVWLNEISSTFLWSLPQSQINSYELMLDQLVKFFKLSDPVKLSSISKAMTTCPDPTCAKQTTDALSECSGSVCFESKISYYCVLKHLGIELKIYADHKQPKERKTVMLMTKMDMKERLKRYFNKEIALKIDKMSLSMFAEFKDLRLFIKKELSAIQGKLGKYFENLATYDKAKSTADIGFITGRVERYRNQIKNKTETVEPLIRNLLNKSDLVTSTNLGERTIRLAVSTALMFISDNPLESVNDVLEKADAVADSFDKIKQIVKMRETYPEVINAGKRLTQQLKKNMDTQKSIRDMILLVYRKNLTPKYAVEHSVAFLKEYNAYSPIFTNGMFKEYETTLITMVESLCDIINSADTFVAKAIVAEMRKDNLCARAKIGVESLMANYEEMYDFQYQLMDAMAAFVRASVAQAGARQLTQIHSVLESTDIQSRENEMTFKIRSLQMFVINYLHKDNMVREACDLIEYKEGGTMPTYCKSLLVDSNTEQFYELIYTDYKKDMCSHYMTDFFYIPAKIRDEKTGQLPDGVIDLQRLYNGEEVYFKIPDHAWLVKHRFRDEQDANRPTFIKMFELYLPLEPNEDSKYVQVHIDYQMMTDNRITPGGKLYSFEEPIIYTSVYRENGGGSCPGRIISQHPYDVKYCPRLLPPCVISEGRQMGNYFHPSIYSKWMIVAHVNNLKRPDPAGNFYLRARVQYCHPNKAIGGRNKRTSKKKRSGECCFNKQMSRSILNTETCQPCPNGSCPVPPNGYYCRKCKDKK